MRSLRRAIRRSVRVAVLAGAALGANPAAGEEVFTLAFEGPDSLSGFIGEPVEGTFACTLTHEGDGPGAEGWSFGVEAGANGRITGIGFEGTDAARLFQGPLEETLFIRGNANGDSRVNISDAVWILNELFFAGAASPCQEAADANDDGVIGASDAVHIMHHQLLGGPAPAPPFPFCGGDPEGEDDGGDCIEGPPVCG